MEAVSAIRTAYRLRVWAVSSGQLAMTLPESPKSRKQRYDAV